jgi:hypothetical protein
MARLVSNYPRSCRTRDCTRTLDRTCCPPGQGTQTCRRWNLYGSCPILPDSSHEGDATVSEISDSSPRNRTSLDALGTAGPAYCLERSIRDDLLRCTNKARVELMSVAQAASLRQAALLSPCLSVGSVSWLRLTSIPERQMAATLLSVGGSGA